MLRRTVIPSPVARDGLVARRRSADDGRTTVPHSPEATSC